MRASTRRSLKIKTGVSNIELRNLSDSETFNVAFEASSDDGLLF